MRIKIKGNFKFKEIERGNGIIQSSYRSRSSIFSKIEGFILFQYVIPLPEWGKSALCAASITKIPSRRNAAVSLLFSGIL